MPILSRWSAFRALRVAETTVKKILARCCSSSDSLESIFIEHCRCFCRWSVVLELIVGYSPQLWFTIYTVFTCTLIYVSWCNLPKEEDWSDPIVFHSVTCAHVLVKFCIVVPWHDTLTFNKHTMYSCNHRDGMGMNVILSYLLVIWSQSALRVIPKDIMNDEFSFNKQTESLPSRFTLLWFILTLTRS